MKQYLALIATILMACNQNSPNKEVQNDELSLKEQLQGTWSNTYMKLEMPTVGGSDSSSAMEVTEANWEQTLGIHPIKTNFKADGTYDSFHFDLKDSLVYSPVGKWELKGDSLFMTDTSPKPGITYSYKLSFSKDSSGNAIATFSGIEDFDQDGVRDDLYFGKQRKLK